jgi:hypothetical protein
MARTRKKLRAPAQLVFRVQKHYPKSDSQWRKCYSEGGGGLSTIFSNIPGVTVAKLNCYQSHFACNRSIPTAPAPSSPPSRTFSSMMASTWPCSSTTRMSRTRLIRSCPTGCPETGTFTELSDTNCYGSGWGSSTPQSCKRPIEPLVGGLAGRRLRLRRAATNVAEVEDRSRLDLGDDASSGHRLAEPALA